jgi:hypothetical protein
MVAVTELLDRLNRVRLLDLAIGPIKTRNRGYTGGQLLVGMACAQLAGEDFLVGLDRYRADTAGQGFAAVPGLCSTTAAGLARRFTEGQWRAVETGIGEVHAAMLALLPAARGSALCDQVTIDLDTTDVEVYGRLKREVAFNHQGQRVGRVHVATWADTATVLAADLMSGRDDPRGHAAGLLARALAALPAPARRGRIRLRADAGYFAGELARAALLADVEFAIGARRIAPLWRLLDGVAKDDWTEAIDMTGAQVAVADYCPDWWPATTRLLIRRVRLNLDHGQVSADPRSRRRGSLHPDQRALPLTELADADAVYGYSFIVTNLDVSTPDRAATIEHWYRHRTMIENLFRDAKLGAALRHLPSGHRRHHRWLATPAHRDRRGRRSAVRAWRPRRPSHDRHPATPTDPRPSPADPPRRRADPAPATRTPPARRGPRPHPRPACHPLTTATGHRDFRNPLPRSDTRAPRLPTSAKQTQNDQSPRK